MTITNIFHICVTNTQSNRCVELSVSRKFGFLQSHTEDFARLQIALPING